jgi:4-diphosphocytidyl-2-C-methyl-D-erythritol kinase
MTVGLYDTVTVTLGEAVGGFACQVTVTTEGLPAGLAEEAACTGLPLEKNTVFQAVQLFNSRHPLPAVEVRLTKRIPAGAGLGGASTDGAAVLAGLGRLCGLPFDDAILESLALELGSDVPFSLRAINGRAGEAGVFCAQARGRGELLREVACPFSPPFWVVLVHPGLFSGTKRAYALLDQHREKRRIEAYTPDETEPASLCYNSFLPVFLEYGLPEERRLYQALLAGLRESGASFYGLTGSGAVCFGIFFDALTASDAACNLSKKWAWCYKS